MGIAVNAWIVKYDTRIALAVAVAVAALVLVQGVASAVAGRKPKQAA